MLEGRSNAPRVCDIPVRVDDNPLVMLDYSLVLNFLYQRMASQEASYTDPHFEHRRFRPSPSPISRQMSFFPDEICTACSRYRPGGIASPFRSDLSGAHQELCSEQSCVLL